MKTKILILLICALYACLGENKFFVKTSEQSSVQIPTSSNDTIQCSDVLLNGVRILSSPEEIQAGLGNPDTIFTIVDSVDYESIENTILMYGQSELSFYRGKLYITVLKDNFIGVTKENIKVGDSVSHLSSIFPLSYNNLERKSYKSMIVYFKDCEAPVSLTGYVSFEYDENSIIKRILIRFFE